MNCSQADGFFFISARSDSTISLTNSYKMHTLFRASGYIFHLKCRLRLPSKCFVYLSSITLQKILLALYNKINSCMTQNFPTRSIEKDQWDMNIFKGSLHKRSNISTQHTTSVGLQYFGSTCMRTLSVPSSIPTSSTPLPCHLPNLQLRRSITTNQTIM